MNTIWISKLVACLACASLMVACGDDDPAPTPDADATVEPDEGGADADAGTSDEGSDTVDAADEGPDAPDEGPNVPDEGADALDGGADGDASDLPDEGPDVPTQTTTPAHVFSGDGSTIVVRFAESVDAAGAGAASAYEVSGGVSVTALNVIEEALGGGTDVVLTVDPALDPATTYDLTLTGVVNAAGVPVPDGWTSAVYGKVHLNILWHQHQPSYLDPAKDQLQGPWVRKHATKDYFDMTAMLLAYPKIHFNMNLTSSLLQQLQLYVDRLGPYVDVAANTVDEAGFAAQWAGQTDPWVDQLLEDTPSPVDATEAQLDRFYAGVWSCRSIAEPLLSNFPEYQALVAKSGEDYTQVDLAHLKVFFEIGWMDPDFLDGPVVVYSDEGADVVVDLSDVVTKNDEGLYVLDAFYTEAGDDAELLSRLETLANRLVAENYKIMRGTFEIHAALSWDGTDGQVEVLTTPFFHPILPLLYDTDLAQEGQPADMLPSPSFAYPEDAAMQIALAVTYYTGLFGQAPRGMWPSEGAVAEEIVPAFRDNGIDWIATDRQVLEKGMSGASHLVPYRVDSDDVVGDGGDSDDEMMVVFRDTEVSDKVGFFYQSNPPADSAADFLFEVWDAAPKWGEADHALSVILDGENAWEWYTQDHDAKQFLHLLYAGLEGAYDEGSVVTVTGSEYIDGNDARGVAPHPVGGLTEYEDLFPGSWIGGRLDTWIGEVEENIAWSYLTLARADFEAARVVLEPLIGMPESLLEPPDPANTALTNWWRAWRAVLSAEGSDWFWWYGTDQTSAGGDDSPFDEIFRAQLTAMYTFMNLALVEAGEDPFEVPGFAPILQPEPVKLAGGFKTVPTLDGLVDPEDEWVPPAGLFFDNDTAGAIDDPDDDIGWVAYGYDGGEGGTLYFGIDLKEDLSAKLGTDYQLVLYTNHGNVVEGPEGTTVEADPFNATTAEGLEIAFSSGGPARRVAIDFAGAEPVMTLENADGEGGWAAVGAHTMLSGGPVEGGTLLEIAVPMADLGMSFGDPVEFAVVAVDGGSAVDYAPNLGTRIMFADPTKLVTVVIELDVTGAEIDINTFVTIANPPPPEGTGTPSIVGNIEEFGNWTPNSVAMLDDGEGEDKEAGDGIYTLHWSFVPGTDLQYKFTIGDPGTSWSGTEEFPLTNRGFTVPADGTQKVRVRCIFADRPDPSGSMAALTTVTVED